MSVMETNNAIEQKLIEIDQLSNKLRGYAEKKAQTASDYDKAIAITILKLSNGQVMELDGQKVQDPKATIIEKISRGICWKEKLDMDTADSCYKGLIVKLDCLRAVLCGYQSISRTQSELINN